MRFAGCRTFWAIPSERSGARREGVRSVESQPGCRGPGDQARGAARGVGAPASDEPAGVQGPPAIKKGSEWGPVALPVFKTGRCPLDAGGLGSTPRRFRHLRRMIGHARLLFRAVSL